MPSAVFDIGTGQVLFLQGNQRTSDVRKVGSSGVLLVRQKGRGCGDQRWPRMETMKMKWVVGVFIPLSRSLLVTGTQ